MSNTSIMANRAEILKEKFLNSVGLPFQDVLSAAEIERVLESEQLKYRNSVFSPVVTVWAFLSQVLDPDKSLRQAVSRVIAWLNAAGEALPSSDTGAYSKARSRLTERIVEKLFQKTVQGLEAPVPESALWCGRKVRVCDGTSILMSDTPDNQQAYPQHSNQAPGCGFPIAKLVVMFSLSTGAVVDALISAFNTSELVMARQLYDQLTPGEVMLADSAFGNYGDMVLIHRAGADGVFRKHHARSTDFRRGKKLGIGDHIVTWHKPQRCPKAIPLEVWSQLPESLQVREVHLLITQAGFRPKEIILVTTLLDVKVYTKSKLAQLYQQRWQAAEVNLRHLKTTLCLEMVSAKTPAMVRKEIWMHLMAYNLLRKLMWQAAQSAQVAPLSLSVQGTRQHFQQLVPLLAHALTQQRQRLFEQLLAVLTTEQVPSRPNRVEPRVKKRRPKAYPWMQQPRSVLQAKLAA